jgi:hypothetical protein
VAAQSKESVHGRSLLDTVGSNPARMSLSCECCVLSGRDLCVAVISSSQSPTDCRVFECDLTASKVGRPRRTTAVEP